MKMQWLLVDSACHPRDRERLGSSGSNNKMQPGSPRCLGHWAVGSACFIFTGRSHDPRAQGHLPCEPPTPCPCLWFRSAFDPGSLLGLQSCHQIRASHVKASQEFLSHSPSPERAGSPFPGALFPWAVPPGTVPPPRAPLRTRSCPSFG